MRQERERRSRMAEEPTAAPGQEPGEGGKTFTEDYVSALRSESAGHRTKAKTYESTLRAVLGVKDGEELGDLNARMAAWQQEQTQKQSAVLEAANGRLIQAELLRLEGYDHKLLAKLIDLSGIQVDDAGNVKGLLEAAQAAAKEYPAVLAEKRRQYAPANPATAEPPAGENRKMNDLIRGRK